MFNVFCAQDPLFYCCSSSLHVIVVIVCLDCVFVIFVIVRTDCIFVILEAMKDILSFHVFKWAGILCQILHLEIIVLGKSS